VTSPNEQNRHMWSATPELIDAEPVADKPPQASRFPQHEEPDTPPDGIRSLHNASPPAYGAPPTDAYPMHVQGPAFPVSSPPPTGPVSGPISGPPSQFPPSPAGPISGPPFPSSGPPHVMPPAFALEDQPERRKSRAGLIALVGVLALVVVGGGTAAAVALTGDDKADDKAATTPVADKTLVPATTAPDGAKTIDGQAPGKASSVPGTAAADPNLVLAEEFNALDTKTWGVYTSTSPNGAVWSSSQVRAEGGELRIVGAGKNSGGMCWCDDSAQRQYGIWKVRARFDAGTGFGPVVGLWPKSDKATDGTMTFAGLPQGNRKEVRQFVTWPGHSFEKKTAGDFTAWHTYTIEWRATFVKMYVDDRLTYDSATSPIPVTLPTQPMHLYFQQAVGPDDGVPKADAGTPSQVIVHVDWARIYK
jgi:hypothetical protein